MRIAATVNEAECTKKNSQYLMNDTCVWIRAGKWLRKNLGLKNQVQILAF